MSAANYAAHSDVSLGAAIIEMLSDQRAIDALLDRIRSVDMRRSAILCSPNQSVHIGRLLLLESRMKERTNG